MGGLFGGGGGGSTQTVTQSNIPFNAQQLQTVQNAAIDLGQNNPLNFYPGQIYAPPDPYFQTGALGNIGNTAMNAGNLLATQTPWLQQDAIYQNQRVADGSNVNALSPIMNAINGMANINAAQPGINYLSPVANGGFFTQEQPYMFGLANAAYGPGGSELGNISGGQLLNAASPYYNGLYNLQNGGAAQGLGGTAGMLQGLTNGNAANALSYTANGNNLGATQGLVGGLAGLANGTAANDLAATAGGAYLNANPYLTGMFNAAAQPVINAFQTATAPTIDSQMAANGRFGSGANLNAQSVAQQNLGQTLNNLSSNIFGTNYANERGLMNQAATNLGGLQQGALAGAGGLYNTGVGLQSNAANSLFGNQANALSHASNAYNSLFGNQTNALTNAGNIYGNQSSILANAAGNLGNLNVSGLSGAANAYNNAVDQITRAGTETGMLGLQGQAQQMQGFQNQINDTLGLSNQQLNAANALTGLSQLPFQDYQAANTAGTGLQQNSQAAINALIQQFMGQQQAPWQTLQTEAGIVGSGIPGMSAVTSPVPSSPFGSILGGLTGANALLGQNGLFGSGGLLGSNGGLFGASGLFGSAGPLFGAGVDPAISSAIGGSLANTAATGVLPAIGDSAITDFLPLLFA